MIAPGLRVATAADAPLLAATHALCFTEEPWPAEAIAGFLESPGVFGLIGDSETADATPAAGFILCRIAADEAEVLSLAVLPAARRAGLAGRLLADALAWAAACGVSATFLEVAEDNRAALALYRGAGFSGVGRRPGYYRRGAGFVAALVLSRPLAGCLSPSPP
ncbi:MAG: N-acetyltransferase [Rhodospirillaceae bacterium]